MFSTCLRFHFVVGVASGFRFLILPSFHDSRQPVWLPLLIKTIVSQEYTLVVGVNLLQSRSIMDTMESCVPPGFRFHPTDEELVGYYLKKKVASKKIDLDVIRDIDLYRIEPWDLQERCRMGYEEQNEWYFFSHKDKKYPTGSRTNRATMAGFWKATGRDKAVKEKTKLIGMRKTLVFYKGRAPNGLKTDWIMHEYRLESDENGLPQEEGWVVCRAFKKRASIQSKAIEGSWDSSSSYFYGVNFPCKQEIESDALNFLRSDRFVQLPQLESPSPPLLKRSTNSISLMSDHSNNDNNNNDDDQEDDQDQNNKGCMEKVTDWRALDKFVASQLSQDVNGSGDGIHQAVSGFGEKEEDNKSEMETPLLQSGRDDEEENNKSNWFLMSDSDIGICIFERL
ncbi:hypothetical protein Nepgr_016746 [Nepenthes gracilis]|uniref:NAC domain-containing protein n=1 Tax=Nepenthes gracilis TaxID=150966 RepID=A0AAD3SQA4_NEPGR|nr:hypothetical protein Nepgr_016746 [Nepenthes gracilis]